MANNKTDENLFRASTFQCGPMMNIEPSASGQSVLAIIKHELGNAFSATQEAETVLAQLTVLQAELAEAEALYHKAPSDAGLKKVLKTRDTTNQAAIAFMYLTNAIWHRVGGSHNLSSALEKIQSEIRRDFGAVLKLHGI